MTPRGGVRAAVLTLVLGTASPLRAQTTASVEALDRWATAVGTHTPGQPDAAVAEVVSLSYGQRSELYPAMRMFLAYMRGQKFATKEDGAKRVTALARRVQENPGTEVFLKRAALLHTDAAVFSDRFPAAPDDAPPEPPVSPRPGTRRAEPPPPPLLWNERVVLTRDGQLLGEATVGWHLVFARSLVEPRPSGFLARDDDFIGEWYHAVSAYLFAIGNNGDAKGHLGRAEQVLPNDARVLFDRACYAETLGLPIYQAVSNDPASRNRNDIHADLPPEERTNAEAERLYRRALEVDPSFVEARVRLARLLDHRGRREEAAGQIANALDAKPAGVVGFYARIVAGRIASARGRYDEALQHYRDAATLFAGAQSALLGASHAALMTADVPATLAPLEHLSAESATLNADPWWDYQLGAGRDVNALMAHLWSRVVAK